LEISGKEVVFYRDIELGSHSFGSFGPGVKCYFFPDELRMFVKDDQLYGIWVHSASHNWEKGNTVYANGRDLRKLSIEDAKELLGASEKFHKKKIIIKIG